MSNYYYYKTKTTMSGDSTDPAKQIARKYSETDIKIFYGNTEAIIRIDKSVKPIVSESYVEAKTKQEIKDLTDKKLKDYGFDGEDFIKDDKEEK